MRTFYIAFLLFILPFFCEAQFSSSAIKVVGDICVEKNLNLDSLAHFAATTLKNFPITNKRGELKYIIKEARGCAFAIPVERRSV